MNRPRIREASELGAAQEANALLRKILAAQEATNGLLVELTRRPAAVTLTRTIDVTP